MPGSKSIIYLLPSPLDENAAQTIPGYVADAAQQCDVFFVENERSARRFLKKIRKEIIIDDYEWVIIGNAESQMQSAFKNKIRENKIIGIISEAGCPCVADPGQLLVAIAQELNIEVKPFVGPSSILLALMASGMNGQAFQFTGYLPIKEPDRTQKIKELENESAKKSITQIFIETPYRNNQLLESLLKHCRPATRLCIAVDLTAETEWIKTKTIAEWKKNTPGIHKRPAIFCLLSA
jgi:16S rRNA (cytidine1402-2'-O)-methyltransferase